MKNSIKDIRDLETPCYIIDEKKLENNFNYLNDAFRMEWGDNFKIGYSFKTNSVPWLLSWMKKKGAYAEVVSEPEFLLARESNFLDNEIILNGPYKGFNSMKNILDSGGIVNLDSFHEIAWIENNKPAKCKSWNVGLRINFDLETYCPGQTITGTEFSRFGFNIDNGSFYEAVNRLKKIDYVKITGLHSHNSTKTKSLDIFRTSAMKIVESARMLSKDDICYIDMGGAFWGDKLGVPTFSDYAKCISEELGKYFDPKKVTLIVEPGAALIASPVEYLFKVLDIKRVGDSTFFVSTDGSLIHINPLMNSRKFKINHLSNNIEILRKQIICGFTCIELDRIGILENSSRLKVDDLLSVNNIGSYSISLSPLFIQYFPSIYVRNNSHYLSVRDKWTVKEYIRRSIF